MKVILCTGDSHTEGQGGTGHLGGKAGALGYNHLGKGFPPENAPYSTCYVGLLEDYVAENTASEVKHLDVSKAGKALACFHRLTEFTLSVEGGDLLVLRISECREKSVLCVYVDGTLTREITLQADTTRFGDYSIKLVAVPCKDAKQVRLVCKEGETYINSAVLWSGEYALVNCGVGACNCVRYYNEYIDELIEEFDPYMFIAESHTINDWLATKTPEAYGKDLEKLINKMKENSKCVIATTVSPIMGSQENATSVDFYENFVAESKKVLERTGVIAVDSHDEMENRIKGLSEHEAHSLMYSDDWHVNDVGHKIYAEKIIEKLKDIL